METIENKTTMVEGVNEEKSDLFKQFDNLMMSLNTLKMQFNYISNEVRSIEKNVKKEMKNLKKAQLKKKSPTNRKPSGFAKPVKISDELRKFIGVEEGVEMARTEVTKELIKYIKKNGLSNSRKINLDDKLRELIGDMEEGVELTYFNMQKYMNRHYLN